MLFHGPPGVGKTMLAERVPGVSLISICTTPSKKSLRCARSLDSTLPTSSSPDRHTVTRTIRHRWQASSMAVSGKPGRAPSHAHTKVHFFWMTPRKPNPSDWTKFIPAAPSGNRSPLARSGESALASRGPRSLRHSDSVFERRRLDLKRHRGSRDRTLYQGTTLQHLFHSE
jgi:hypothetical protein